MSAIDRRSARAELDAILSAYDARDEQEFRAACQRWHLIRFPEDAEDADWIPKDDDYVRFRDGHVNAGKIERVSSIMGPPRSSAIWARLVGVIDLVDPAVLEPWLPWANEWVTFRGGHALAGYSYPVIGSDVTIAGGGYTGIMLKLQSVVYPVKLSEVMPAGNDRIIVGPGCTLTPRA